MKSTAHFKGHPLHPILVCFPIAFFIGSLLFDVLGVIKARHDFHNTGKYLQIAGIISALLAAIPGIIDYLFTVPPKSTGKKRALKHGLINISMLIVFSLALYYRQGSNTNMYVLAGIELFGTALLFIAGWLGGTLVYRNQIGVNPRYANAGKWKEVYLKIKATPLEVAIADELKVDQMKLVHAGNQRIVIAKTENGYVAFDDHCTHRGGSLAGGAMICGTVQCPWHGSQFDVQTGEVKAGPAVRKIHTYRVTESDGKVFIHLESPDK